MPKTSTDQTRHTMSGDTMGTRWSAQFFAAGDVDTAEIDAAVARAVGEVDDQMSTWKPASNLMQLNRAEPGEWLDIPPAFTEVLQAGLEIGVASGGAFDIAVGEAVNAWGFGPDALDAARIRDELGRTRQSAADLLELDPRAGRARKHAALSVDLSGIAKGYGVDRMVETLSGFGIKSMLVGLDGELRARGLEPDGKAWTVAVERPDYERRAPLSILCLHDAAVATSGDYRHWVDLGPQRLSHTMDPVKGGPVAQGPASVSVIAETCIDADAWATALMVLGTDRGAKLAMRQGLSALFIDRSGDELHQTPVGPNFEPPDAQARDGEFAGRGLA